MRAFTITDTFPLLGAGSGGKKAWLLSARAYFRNAHALHAVDVQQLKFAVGDKVTDSQSLQD